MSACGCGEAPQKHQEEEPVSASVDALLTASLLQNPNKAGTGGRSKDEINAIIKEASKNSAFTKKAVEKMERLSKDIEFLKERAAKITPADLEASGFVVKELVESAKATRNLTRTIVHVDMDAFYASIETLDRPDLNEKPMAVGGPKSGGTLCTANYVARKYGVRSAMATHIAKKLCPELVVLTPNFSKYEKKAAEIRAVFAKYHEKYTPTSLDEAYLDITDYLKRNPRLTAEETVSILRQEIFEVSQLTASAGIGCNKMIAKICSDMNKPNGQYFVPPDPEKISEFMKNLPIRKVPGIGNVSEQYLKALNIENCGDLELQLPRLRLLLTPALFDHCKVNISLGIGSTDVDRDESAIQKAIGREQTAPMKVPEAMYKELERLTEQLETDMASAEVVGRCVTLKMKDISFTVSQRSKTTSHYISTADDIFTIGQELLAKELRANPDLNLRLIGIRMTSLIPKKDLEERKQFFTKNGNQEAVESDSDREVLLACPLCFKKVERAMLTVHVISCVDKDDKAQKKSHKSSKSLAFSENCGESLSRESRSRVLAAEYPSDDIACENDLTNSINSDATYKSCKKRDISGAIRKQTVVYSEKETEPYPRNAKINHIGPAKGATKTGIAKYFVPDLIETIKRIASEKAVNEMGSAISAAGGAKGAKNYEKVYVRAHDEVWKNTNGIIDGMIATLDSLSALKLRNGIHVRQKEFDEYIFYRLGLALPHIAAGDNLNMPGLGKLLRQCGAFFIRRTWGDDVLYNTVMKEYVEILLRQGHNIMAFTEGTRSRIGKLLQPKFGIMKIILEAVLSGRVTDCMIVPMSIGYDKVIETGSYVSELLGVPKQKESLYQLMSNMNILSLKWGRIDVSFGKAFSLKEYIGAHTIRRGIPLNPATSKVDRDLLLQSLGYRVLSDINKISVIMPTALVGTMVLTLRGRGVGRNELIRKVDWLTKIIEMRGGSVADFHGKSTAWVVDRAVQVLRDLIGQRNDLLEPVFYPAKRFELSFYRNQVIHLFITEAILSCALYATVKQGGPVHNQKVKIFPDLERDCTFISKLLKSEFIYGPNGLTDNMLKTIDDLTSLEVMKIETEILQDGKTEVKWLSLSSEERRIGRETFGTGDLSYFEAVNGETLKNGFQRLKQMGVILFRKHKKGSESIPMVALCLDWCPKTPLPKAPKCGKQEKTSGSLISSDVSDSAQDCFDETWRYFVPEGRLWELCEQIGRYRREGKNRRDTATVATRVLSLAAVTGLQVMESETLVGRTRKKAIAKAKL
ncbi:hypothetical protein HDU82_000582 [Entophlyctis luteolus]|nr:hypothetical protein HDU82_000582 [Entophlyctis luteolus]